MENKMQKMDKYSKSYIEDLSTIICATAICKACLDNVFNINEGLDKEQEFSADLGEVKDMNEYGKNWKSTPIKKVAEKTKMNEGYIEKAVNKIFDRIRNDEDARAILRGNEIDPDKSMNEILQSIHNIWQGLERNDKRYFAEKVAGVRSSNLFCTIMETFDDDKTDGRCETMKTSAKPKERVHLGRLVLQCAKDDGLTVPDWDFILKGISIIDEVTLKGLVSDASAVIRAVSEKLKEHDVLCGRMIVEVTV